MDDEGLGVHDFGSFVKIVDPAVMLHAKRPGTSREQNAAL
jgi:hypothetical protein